MTERHLIIGAVLLGLIAYLAFRILRSRTSTQPLSEWFTVEFDESKVTLSARPPDRASWEQSFLWSEVVRVCFKSEGELLSDGVYVFTTQRPESFVVPTEAKGGVQFWSKVVERGLFPAELALKAATLSEGTMSCWPAVGEVA